MGTVYAEGGNYRIEIDAGVARCRVWKRPDVDAATGAGFAREKIGHFAALARGGQARAMLFDLREAPPVTGPKTQEALGQMFAPFEDAKKPIAILVGEVAMQQLQMKRLAGQMVPSQGRVFTREADALAHVRRGPGSSRRG